MCQQLNHCICCLLCLLFIPIILLAAGIAILNADNDRDVNIAKWKKDIAAYDNLARYEIKHTAGNVTAATTSDLSSLLLQRRNVDLDQSDPDRTGSNLPKEVTSEFLAAEHLVKLNNDGAWSSSSTPPKLTAILSINNTLTSTLTFSAPAASKLEKTIYCHSGSCRPDDQAHKCPDGTYYAYSRTTCSPTRACGMCTGYLSKIIVPIRFSPLLGWQYGFGDEDTLSDKLLLEYIADGLNEFKTKESSNTSVRVEFLATTDPLITLCRRTGSCSRQFGITAADQEAVGSTLVIIGGVTTGALVLLATGCCLFNPAEGACRPGSDCRRNWCDDDSSGPQNEDGNGGGDDEMQEQPQPFSQPAAGSQNFVVGETHNFAWGGVPVASAMTAVPVAGTVVGPPPQQMSPPAENGGDNNNSQSYPPPVFGYRQ